jgi:CubicO group peptidase (beta-lactamase class C family)
MKSLSLFCILLFIISCNASPERNQHTFISAAEAGFPDSNIDEINSVMDYEIGNNRIAGAVVLLARNGAVFFNEAYGWKDKAGEIPMQTHHLFRMASMTKPVTSVAIMQLAERGKIELTDPLEKYIPEFANPTVIRSYNRETGTYETRPAENSITIHDLLTHTSGISYGFTNAMFGAIYRRAGIPDLGSMDSLTIGQSMASLGGQPLAHEPGERFTYGLSTDVLGRVVEVASGMTLSEYFQENIFKPLGMNDTGFYLPGRDEDLTSLHTIRDNKLLPYPTEGPGAMSSLFPVSGAMMYYSGGAGLTSSALDYFTFLQALKNGGEWSGKRILKEETWKAMISNQIGDLSLNGNKFGYGFMIITEEGAQDGKRAPGSLSWGGAFQTTFWIDPANDLIAILLTQVIPSPFRDELYDSFERAVYK